jgi:hypothetical protein
VAANPADVDPSHLSVESIIRTYADRLAHAYPDDRDEVYEERDTLLAWYEQRRPQPRPPSFMESPDGLRVWALEQVEIAQEQLWEERLRRGRVRGATPGTTYVRLAEALRLPRVRALLDAQAEGHAAVAILAALNEEAR